MTEHTVPIGDQYCKVYVSQKFKTVWLAVGEIAGHWIREKGSSATSALEHWADAAKDWYVARK